MSCLSYRKKIQGEPSSFWVMGRRTDYWNVPPFSISLCEGSLFVFFGCQGNDTSTHFSTTPRLCICSCFWIDYSCYRVLFSIFQFPGLHFENEPFQVVLFSPVYALFHPVFISFMLEVKKLILMNISLCFYFIFPGRCTSVNEPTPAFRSGRPSSSSSRRKARRIPQTTSRLKYSLQV